MLAARDLLRFQSSTRVPYISSGHVFLIKKDLVETEGESLFRVLVDPSCEVLGDHPLAAFGRFEGDSERWRRAGNWVIYYG